MEGKGHIKVKVKYLHPFKFYVAHTLCKRLVCIRLKCYLLRRSFYGLCAEPVTHVDNVIQHD